MCAYVAAGFGPEINARRFREAEEPGLGLHKFWEFDGVHGDFNQNKLYLKSLVLVNYSTSNSTNCNGVIPFMVQQYDVPTIPVVWS